MINNVDDNINISNHIKKTDEKYKYNCLIKICKLFFCKCNKNYFSKKITVNNNLNKNSEFDIILEKNKDLMKQDLKNNYINNDNSNFNDKNDDNSISVNPFKKKYNSNTIKFNKKCKSESSNKNNKFINSNSSNNIKEIIKRIKNNSQKSIEKLRYKNGGIVLKNNIKQDTHFFNDFKDKIRCFFCGGKNCKHENYLNNIKNNNAIEGLNSNFITEDIIASQRPSEVLIQQFHLVHVFKEMNIGLIVNLQREGEHPYCGPNAHHLTSVGYAYNPGIFSGDDIKCKLSGWKDMSVPSSMNFMLDIVKHMCKNTIDKKKKCLVHCHAGYGRTGVVIVCYLLYISNKDSDTIIEEVRKKRKKCVETKNQIKYCKKFEDFLNISRILFGEKHKIDIYLKRQEDILFGIELKKYGFIPKIIAKVLEKIEIIRVKHNITNIKIYSYIQGGSNEWNDKLEETLSVLKSLINKNDWDLFEKNENIILFVELLFDWFEDCVEYIISPERTEKIINSLSYQEYLKFINNPNFEKETETYINIIHNLIHIIKKTYILFEYEIIYTFVDFFSMFPPLNNEEKLIFNTMIDRICLELLGYSFSEANYNKEYNNATQPLINGLNNIFNVIFNYLLECSSNLYYDKSIILPQRNNYNTNNFKNIDNNDFFITRRKSANQLNLISNKIKLTDSKNSSFYSLGKKNAIEKYLRLNRILTQNEKKNISENKNKNEEKKLFKIYEILHQYFGDKKSQNENENIQNESLSSRKIGLKIVLNI